jgi:hypothetical protein
MRTCKLLLPLLFLASLAFSQTQTVALPECTLNFALNSTNLNSANYTNALQNCQTWPLTVYNVGFSGFSLTLQSAPPATTSTPGAFVTYAGTVSTGSNPLTALGTSTFSNGTVAIGYLRLHLSGLTGSGTVYGVLQGWNSGSSGGGGGGSSGCVGTQTTPCVTTIACPNSAAIALTSSGLTQILALSAGKVITVCHISAGFASGVNFQLEYGTGAACGTGTTAETGVFQSVQGIALDVPFSLPASQALCVNLGSSVTGGGLLIYAQQ